MFNPNLHAAHASCWVEINEKGNENEERKTEGYEDSHDRGQSGSNPGQGQQVDCSGLA
jgi:hypothetical protein